MTTRATKKKKRIKAQVEAKKPRPCISGQLVGKTEEKAIIDRFLHRQAVRAYKTYKGLAARQGTTDAEDWLEGQVVYWKHVTGTIEMMRAWNYPHGWRPQ